MKIIEYAITFNRIITAEDIKNADSVNVGMLEQVTDTIACWHSMATDGEVKTVISKIRELFPDITEITILEECGEADEDGYCPYLEEISRTTVKINGEEQQEEQAAAPEQKAEEQAAEEQQTEEQQQQPRKTKFYNPDWALKCVASDFGENAAEFLEMHPIERGCKSYLVEWKCYTIDGEQTESLYVSGCRDELTAKSIAIVATFGTCGKKLKYIEY